MGADVVKIEDTGAGDYAREMVLCTKHFSVFRLANRNKRGMRLELKIRRGARCFCGSRKKQMSS